MRSGRPAPRAADSREALLAAATSAFARHGFAGASVDDIARAARVNKAMIYYHFRSKHGLYLEVIRAIFSALVDRTTVVAASPLPPALKIEQYLDAVNAEIEAHPNLPQIMMREMADGARRLDADTLKLLARVMRNLAAILEAGRGTGSFQPSSPVMTYFSLVAPIIFFRAAAPMRAAMARSHVFEVPDIDPADFLALVKANALRALAAPQNASRRPKAAPRSTRPGESE